MAVARPPIVVILGHVDHGKTTLLDAIRKTDIASREAGGITQSVRAFQVRSTINEEPITFIDTPGHAAFSQMRSRGSDIADLAILVVAANDGVMPQTKESIEFIKSAGIPFVVAINKSDLPESQPDRVKTQLTESGVVVEDYGGDVPAVLVSAKTGQGLDDLLEMISLVSQLHPPQADPGGQLEAVVLESRLDSKKGSVAIVIIKNGTLATGQSLFQTGPIGKARALTATTGERIDSAPPSTPVEILGLSSVPSVGSVISSSPTAILPTPGSELLQSQVPASTLQHQSSTANVNIILKADVLGSLEAVTNSLDSSGADIVFSATGDVSESDVLSARSTGSIILGFNVRVSSSAAKLAEIEKVRIRTHSIIYELLDDMDKLLNPPKETVLGHAEVVAEFKIDADRIAGCRVIEGTLSKADKIHLKRGDVVLGDTRFKTLKTGKADILQVKTGQEFGASFSPYLDFRTGDNIIAFQDASS